MMQAPLIAVHGAERAKWGTGLLLSVLTCQEWGLSLQDSGAGLAKGERGSLSPCVPGQLATDSLIGGAVGKGRLPRPVLGMI